MPDPHGAALMTRLHAAAAEVSDLLTSLGTGRSTPPITSQDRRRVADRADLAKATLDRVRHDLDAWIAKLAPGENPAGLPVEIETAQDIGGGTDPHDDTLAQVSTAREALDRARADLHQTVDDARARGASWRRIGEALGIAAQTAHKRFDPKARRRHADYMRTRYQQLSNR